MRSIRGPYTAPDSPPVNGDRNLWSSMVVYRRLVRSPHLTWCTPRASGLWRSSLGWRGPPRMKIDGRRSYAAAQAYGITRRRTRFLTHANYDVTEGEPGRGAWLFTCRSNSSPIARSHRRLGFSGFFFILQHASASAQGGFGSIELVLEPIGRAVQVVASLRSPPRAGPVRE